MKIILIETNELLVDDDLYEELSNMYISVSPDGYAKMFFDKMSVGVHRYVLCGRDLNGIDKPIDHIDRNKLNCQRSNLRFCTFTQNLNNTPKRFLTEPSSNYKGVSWMWRKQRFVSRITVNYKTVMLLFSVNELDCAYAYNRAASLLFKDFAYLNPISISEEDKERINQIVDKIVKDKLS